MTEQGEVITAKYTDPVIGRASLERLVAGTLDASLEVRGDGEDAVRRTPRYHRAMAALSGHARTAYRELVYDLPGFAEYFRQSTPLAEIATLNIGSRPASRRGSARIEDLRAIPWVFSWAQCRLLLPGWYGVGTAVERALAENSTSLAELRAMHADWPFFRMLCSNIAMVLAKSDLGVARRYAALVSDDALRERVWPRLDAEWHRTHDTLLAITGQRTLLGDQPALARSIANRFAYMDPLNHLQVALLRRLRAGATGKAAETLRHGIHLTINGIAAGLRNTG